MENKELKIEKVGTIENPADMLTKFLASDAHSKRANRFSLSCRCLGSSSTRAKREETSGDDGTIPVRELCARSVRGGCHNGASRTYVNVSHLLRAMWDCAKPATVTRKVAGGTA